MILHDRLPVAALRLNPKIPEAVIDSALKILCERRRAMPTFTADREVYGLIRAGVRVEIRDADGKNRVEQVRVIDFNDAEANEFLAASQMWIQGEVRYRRGTIHRKARQCVRAGARPRGASSEVGRVKIGVMDRWCLATGTPNGEG